MVALLCTLTAFAASSAAASGSGARVTYTDSIRELPAVSAAATAPHAPRKVRDALTTDETEASMPFEVALRMRSFDEFQARVARGERISNAELSEKYLPTPADYARVRAWLAEQGFTVTHDHHARVAVFARGRVKDVGRVFETTFARVAADGAEFTSAVTAPSLPADLAPVVLGLHGLQPHVRPQPLARLQTAAVAAPPYSPFQVGRVYGANTLGRTGRGQTVAVLAGAYPLSSDLTQFWQLFGVTNSLAHTVQVPVNGGPTTSVDQNMLMEASLDVQWITALTPDATVRIYGFSTNDPLGFELAFEQVYTDAGSIAGLNQFSISMGVNETFYPRDYLLIFAQSTALLTNAGVTLFASSGDDGNNGILLHPASDPNVTSVGGTSLTMNTDGTIVSETTWSGSGGGQSKVFTRPSWQVGQGLSGVSGMRMVPDVAAIADPNTGVNIVVNGTVHQVGGTSLSTPVWAAFSAMINESRTSAGQPPVGPLNPKLYPLLGSASLRDIKDQYGTSKGYDTYTGVGVPNLPSLVASLNTTGIGPVCNAQPTDALITPGQPAAFALVAQGDGPIAYRWERQAKGSTTWSTVAESQTCIGATGPTLVVTDSGYSANGDHFRCVVTNAHGSTTSASALLMVNGCGVTTLAGSPYTVGGDDGVGRHARFGYPGSVRLDAAGNVYVADPWINTIRKVTPGGRVTTVAGAAGQSGSADGAALTTARFNGPGGIAVDTAGNVYVADCNNFTIRRITPDGIVSTIAGGVGISASVDGKGTAARFADPQNLAIDAAGNLYVPDGTGRTVRKITAAGDVSTIAGMANVTGTTDGQGSAARFGYPTGIAIDGSGNVYVADSTNNNVRKITPDGTVSTLPGSFSGAAGVAVDRAANVYVATGKNHTISQITPAGIVQLVAGVSGTPEHVDGPTSGYTSYGSTVTYYPAAQFYHPVDLDIDASGAIYVADGYNCTIRRIVRGTYAIPTISKYPAAQVVVSGQNAVFSLTAAGTELLTYQWQRRDGTTYTNLSDDGLYSGAQTATLTIKAPPVTMNAAGYVCVVSNNFGATTAQTTLYVNGPPIITGQSTNLGVRAGNSITLTAPIGGPVATYLWSLNGVVLTGRSGPQLTISSITTADLGTYTVTATNSYGQVTTTVARLSFGTSRLINLSSRATADSGFNSLFVGCVTRGAGSKTLLVRGAGPSLVPYPFSVADAVPEPELVLYDQKSVELDRNAGWASTDALSAIMEHVGAFPFARGSKDSALVRTLPVGLFSAAVAGKTGPGTALAEIYDTEAYDAPAQLINLSARANIGPNGQLIGGFVIHGDVDMKVLIRGIGPTLRQAPFSISAAIPAVLLTIIRAGDNAEVGRNSVWGGTQVLQDAFSAVNAFGLPSDSKDAACLLTLAPGLYTAVLQSPPDQSLTGIAMIEIYDASP